MVSGISVHNMFVDILVFKILYFLLKRYQPRTDEHQAIFDILFWIWKWIYDWLPLTKLSNFDNLLISRFLVWCAKRVDCSVLIEKETACVNMVQQDRKLEGQTSTQTSIYVWTDTIYVSKFASCFKGTGDLDLRLSLLRLPYWAKGERAWHCHDVTVLTSFSSHSKVSCIPSSP